MFGEFGERGQNAWKRGKRKEIEDEVTNYVMEDHVGH